jgi:tripartite-type tricarboxylate transporter receptor subunit TctC
MKLYFALIKKLLIITFAFLMTGMGIANAKYPESPISLMVSYPPGGATDFQARIVSMMAGEEKYLGQPIVVINKAGAGGKVGWNWFATKSKTNGYDLAAYNIPHFVSQSIVMKDVQYNAKNLEPIANWGADPAVLIVNKDSPFNSVKDLVNFAKKNPGKVTFSGAGKFVGHHLAFLEFEKSSGAKMTYVPHKGAVAGLAAVKGGQIMAGFNNLSDAYRTKNTIKILAVADLERDKDFLPEVPTFKEQGYNVSNASVNFRGFMVRKGTPKEVIDFLAERVPLMFSDKKVANQMKAGGSQLKIMTRAEVQDMWAKREVSLKELLKGLTAN